jgi:hypothetical protein
LSETFDDVLFGPVRSFGLGTHQFRQCVGGAEFLHDRQAALAPFKVLQQSFAFRLRQLAEPKPLIVVNFGTG